MPARDECLEANRSYQASFDKGELPLSPARGLAVVTCIDARIDPARMLGLEEGDAHVIRNAGGLVTDDALRSLVISHQLLGTQEVMVIGHTDCGMLTFTNEDIHAKLREETGADASDIDFQPFSDGEASVREGVARLREFPFIQGASVSGWIYDVRSGGLVEVA